MTASEYLNRAELFIDGRCVLRWNERGEPELWLFVHGGHLWIADERVSAMLRDEDDVDSRVAQWSR